jgi:predicted nucleotidyltransferase
MLTPEQLEDIVQLHAVANEFGAEVAIIGATALLCFIDLQRSTNDVDLVIALDLENFVAFASILKGRGWTQQTHREHRWQGAKGSMVDLVPAGPVLRTAKRIIWPESQFVMSLVGVDHVFSRCVPFQFATDTFFKVAPPPVVALLKIVAYTEDPHRRAKDLTDLKALLRHYDASSERIFGDDIFAAELEDIEYANAFLLGSDIGSIASEEDEAIVGGFLRHHQIPLADLDDLEPDYGHREVRRFQYQLAAFSKGFASSKHRSTR